MKSSFFYGDYCAAVAVQVKNAINAQPDFLTQLTANSPRAVGDAVQSLIAEILESILGDWSIEYFSSFPRRAMEDIAFRDREGFYCAVDIKTHRIDTDFSMPALVSIKRLAQFYEDNMNIFSIIMVKYEVVGTRVLAQKVIFCPIEFLDWECLTIGALGWGQLQITDSNKVAINHGQSRKSWMLALCDFAHKFYPNEVAKIRGRIKHFDEINSHWLNKHDVWT